MIFEIEISTILINTEMTSGTVIELQAMWWRQDGERLERENEELRRDLETMRYELDAMRCRLRAANKKNGGSSKGLYNYSRKPYVTGVPSSWVLVTRRK